MKNQNDRARSFLVRLRTAGLALATAALALTAARADTYLFANLAGNGVALDHTDGTGANARFFNPTALALDASGTLYVADGGDHTIRKVTAGGVVTTFAGASGLSGNTDGAGGAARFQYPYALAVDAGGNVFVVDSGAHTVRKITAAGVVSTLAGSAGVAGSADGAGLAAQFNLPQGIALDSAGNAFVADTGNSTIRRITAAGTVTTFAGAAGQAGATDGAGSAARFRNPYGVTVDSVGNVYVADFGNSTIRKITTGGNVTTFAGSSLQVGTVDGAGSAARFNHPGAISVDAAGNLYVADTSNQTIRTITTGGTVATLAGNAGLGGKTDGVGPAARFFYPFGLAVNAAGTTVQVADTGNHSIRSVSAAGSVSTLAGATGATGSTDGAGGTARFAYPKGLAIDAAGTLYVADHDNHTIRKVTASGTVTTFAGAPGVAGSADGVGSAARFNGPAGTAVDSSGNIYVADADDHVIRKITAAGSVSTLAGGAGLAGSTDGAGAAARFNNPQGVAVDTAGNVFVTDTNNSVIRKITAAGSVSTFAGVAGQTGSLDGTGSAARFNGPDAIAIDSAGNLYVADFGNSTIRKITAAGSVSTVAGLAGQPGFADGAGTAARFNQSYGIALDSAGNLYVADTYNRTIRKISAGVVTTLSGPLSRFYYPQGIAVDAAGNVYVSDGDNHTLTKATFFAAPPVGTPVASMSAAVGQSATFSLNPVPAGVTYQWQVSTNGGSTWTDLANGAPYSGVTTAALTLSNVSAALNGYQFRALLSNTGGTSASGAGTFTITGVARLLNLSARAQVGTGADILIVGLAIGGNGAKQLIIRGVGPALTPLGVAGALATPQLTLLGSNGAALDTNAGWGTAPNAASMSAAFASVGAFALPPNSPDSAILRSLANGNYTAQVFGVNTTTGIALAEFYDLDSGSIATRLINVSARAQVGTGDRVLIAGFAIVGTGTETLLIRGIGPGLTQFGLTNVLIAPRITVFDSQNVVIASNAGWQSSAPLSNAAATVGAFSLTQGSADCAMLLTLPTGNYTVQLSGANSTTGVGLVEIYEMP